MIPFTPLLSGEEHSIMPQACIIIFSTNGATDVVYTPIWLFKKDFIYLFMRERERQRHKHALCRESDVGLDPRTPGLCPGLKAGDKPLSHPGIMNLCSLLQVPSWRKTWSAPAWSPCCHNSGFTSHVFLFTHFRHSSSIVLMNLSSRE